jgi:flagellar hook-basal body complex protein FliE
MLPISGVGGAAAGLSGMGSLGGSSMSAGAASEDFSAMFSNALESVSATERNADQMVSALAAGEDVQLSDVAIATTEATLAVNLLVTIRDQAVQAYQQIANMQI